MGLGAIAAAAGIGYLSGSVLFAIVFSRGFHGADIRAHGSGNPGFTNVYRALSKRAGLATLVCDVGKGAIAVAITRGFLAPSLGADPLALGALAGVSAVAGHALPLYHGFRGGKGVATGAGAFACLVPGATLFALCVWTVALLVSRYMSVASMLGAIAVPVYLTWISRPEPGADVLVPLTWGLATAIVLRHRSNLDRLRRGDEHKFLQRRS